MTYPPPDSALRWATDAVGVGAKVLSVRGMHDGSSPWWLHVEHDGGAHDVVLRVAGWIDPQGIATGAAALRFAEEQDLPAPRLLAADLDGRVAGAPATLETGLAGSSALPTRVSIERLHELGAAIARAHAVPLDPRPDLPLRVRPTSADDHARDRRNGSASTPLLDLADERLRAHGLPQGPTVFVHGDVWWGNTRWDGDRCFALIDWKDAGAGDPGVDLGQLRMQMAITYGSDTPDHVLEAWQRETGRQATDLAYWDAVAALNTPAELEGWPGYADGERLDVSAIAERRDAFLRAALDRL
jgi:aminoglycoside phosphotransferase (APT) family kinase protein